MPATDTRLSALLGEYAVIRERHGAQNGVVTQRIIGATRKEPSERSGRDDRSHLAAESAAQPVLN
jgi:hypothetical protein